MPAHRATPWVYSKLVDQLCADSTAFSAKRSDVIARINTSLRDPFVITEESWGTGAGAEQAVQAWERRFPSAAPPPPPRVPESDTPAP